MKTHYQDITAFITKDGSLIRELMHPAVHGGNWAQSLAEDTGKAKSSTTSPPAKD